MTTTPVNVPGYKATAHMLNEFVEKVVVHERVSGLIGLRFFSCVYLFQDGRLYLCCVRNLPCQQGVHVILL